VSIWSLGPLQPPVQWIPGAFFLRVKRPWREANHSLPSSTEINPLNAELNPICRLLALLGAHRILHISRIKVKKNWSYTSTRPLCLALGQPSFWPSSWDCKGSRIHAKDVLMFVYLLWSQRYRCFCCCDVYRRLIHVCHVLPEASWLCTTQLLDRIRVHALTVPLDCPLVAWEAALNVGRLVLGSFWCY